MKNHIKFGLLLFMGFLSFFLLMRLLGTYTALELRILNVAIHFAGVYYAIKQYHKTHLNRRYNYLNGVMGGVYPSLIGVVFFAIFQFVYLNIDTSFMNHIQENALMGMYLTPLSASIILILEGVTVSFILSYLATRMVTGNLEYKERVEARSLKNA